MYIGQYISDTTKIMKNFALIGLAGFVAKKHISCIGNLKGNLKAALDKHDNVGFIDNKFPECKFFKKENDFFKYIKKKNIDYVIICSPSYLHFKHIKLSLLSGANVIVEKPPILNPEDFKKIKNLEQKTGKKCFCIFQLRLDKKLIKLKKIMQNSNKTKNVQIKYFTYRGDWYLKSWKNKKHLSGGLLVNIAIHFFDILLWIFGDLKKIKINRRTNFKVSGKIELEKAKVNWDVSISNKHRLKFYGVMKIGDQLINFKKFNNLHLENYKEIFKGNFHISEFERIINFLPKLK